jgi:hypothetical protein
MAPGPAFTPVRNGLGKQSSAEASAMTPARPHRCCRGDVARRWLCSKGAAATVLFGSGEGRRTHPRWPAVKGARGSGNGGGTVVLQMAGTVKSCTVKATGVKLGKATQMEKKGRERMVAHQCYRAENRGAAQEFDYGKKIELNEGTLLL